MYIITITLITLTITQPFSKMLTIFILKKISLCIIAYIIVYISMSFNIFIFCYIGEILTQQCKKVGETAYMTDWYRLPRKTALRLILIISRSSVVIKITAGILIQLSIATFSDVIKTSLVYLNMLRTVTT
ncbi:Odorant receptor 365 [Nylanderia fulva]|uniref:Odorant receptor 365 n=1 Tax=Nylanderia fulva TaxID=613905 RepID=A0A6G1LQU9_9HYME|nr:Odorant receptor 365 [Nylanderia fulva]